MEQASCPVCACVVRDQAKVCPSCHTVHHEECWAYADGCAIFGCPEEQFVKPTENDIPDYERALKKWFISHRHFHQLFTLLILSPYLLIAILVLSPLGLLFGSSYTTFIHEHNMDIVVIVLSPSLAAVVLYFVRSGVVEDGSQEVGRLLKIPLPRPANKLFKSNMLRSLDRPPWTLIIDWFAFTIQSLCVVTGATVAYCPMPFRQTLPFTAALGGYFAIDFFRALLANHYFFPRSVKNRLLATIKLGAEPMENSFNKFYSTMNAVTVAQSEEDEKNRRGAFLVLISIGLLATYFGFQELTVSKKSNQKPSVLDMAKLEAGTTFDNMHAVMGEHVALFPYAIHMYEVSEDDKNKPIDENSTLKMTYYPVLSTLHPFMERLTYLQNKYGDLEKAPSELIGTPEHFSVLVKTDRFANMTDVPEGLVFEGGIQGLIYLGREELPRGVKQHFRKYFPKVNLETVVLLADGQRPLPVPLCYFIIFAGILSALYFFVRLIIG